MPSFVSYIQMFVDLELLKIIVDAALCTLIWLVQIIIYPGFIYYNESDLKKWHSSYTGRITAIVMPLMLAQLLLYVFLAYSQATFSSFAGLGLVLMIWAVTFFISVPLHAKIDTLAETIIIRKQLVRTNWMRTVAWTLVLLLTILHYGK